MQATVLLFILAAGVEPQPGLYEPPASVYGDRDTGVVNGAPNLSGTPSSATLNAFGQSSRRQNSVGMHSRSSAPATPVSPYDSSIRQAQSHQPRTRNPVTPVQFETSNGWPQRPTDGLIGTRGGSDEATLPGRRRSRQSVASDESQPAPLSTYTPPNYARDAAKPGDQPSSRSAGDTMNFGGSDLAGTGTTRSQNSGQGTAPVSRYRSDQLSPFRNRPASNSSSTYQPPSQSVSGDNGAALSPAAERPAKAYEANQPKPPRNVPMPNLTERRSGASTSTGGNTPLNPPPPTQLNLPNDSALEYDLTRQPVTANMSDPRPAGGTFASEAGNRRAALDVPPPQIRGNSYFLTLLALFGSIGLNMYLGWISWDTYNRYQDLVGDIRYTSPRRSSARDSASESRLADGAAY